MMDGFNNNAVPQPQVQQQQLGQNQPLPQGTYQNSPQGIQQQQPTGQFAPVAQAPQQDQTSRDMGCVTEVAMTGSGTDKTGKAWTRYKLKIDSPTDGMHSYSMFTGPQKKMQAPPQIGEMIKFGYAIQPNPQSPEHPYRTIIWCGESSGNPGAPQAQSQPIPPQQPQANLQQFVTDYKAAAQQTQTVPNINHFIGTYYVNFVKDTNVMQLSSLFQQNFGQQ